MSEVATHSLQLYTSSAMSNRQDSPSNTPESDDLFFDDKIDALVCSIDQDLRPLAGVAGKLDWHLKGMISHFLKRGQIEGTMNEIIYIPHYQREKWRHLFLIGLGKNTETILPIQAKQALDLTCKRLLQLKLKRVAVSASSFSSLSHQDILNQFPSLEVIISS